MRRLDGLQQHVEGAQTDEKLDAGIVDRCAGAYHDPHPRVGRHHAARHLFPAFRPGCSGPLGPGPALFDQRQVHEDHLRTNRTEGPEGGSALSSLDDVRGIDPLLLEAPPQHEPDDRRVVDQKIPESAYRAQNRTFPVVGGGCDLFLDCYQDHLLNHYSSMTLLKNCIQTTLMALPLKT